MTDNGTPAAPAAQQGGGVAPPANAPIRPTLANFDSIVNRDVRPPAGPPSKAKTSLPAAPALPAVMPGQEPANDNGALPEAAPEPEAPPDAEAAADLLEELMHGRKGREILEAIKAGELPEELLTALKGVAKVNGQDMPVTFREALEGYQRQADYTRGKQEARAARQEAQETMQNMRDMFAQWADGDALLRDVQKLGHMDGFRKAALRFAQEEVRNARWQRENPEAYRLHQQLQKEQGEREALERRLRSQPDPQAAQRQEQFAQRLESLVAPAFAKHGLPDLPQVREEFAKALRALHEDGADIAVTVEHAAITTAQLLGDMAMRYQQSQQPQNGAPARNPSPLPGRPAAPAAAPRQSAKAMTPGDMDEYLKGLRRGRR
jgi:hypothetical protein